MLIAYNETKGMVAKLRLQLLHCHVVRLIHMLGRSNNKQDNANDNRP